MDLTLTVNGVRHTVPGVATHENLLHVLRERIGCTGAKNACEEGRCGSCTVHLDGAAVCACVVPAGQAEGAAVVTVEALAFGGRLSLLQQAFLDAGAVQCGFCTPGMLMCLDELLSTEPNPSEERIRHRLLGNLCRCTGYQKIIEGALLAVARGAAVAGREP